MQETLARPKLSNRRSVSAKPKFESWEPSVNLDQNDNMPMKFRLQTCASYGEFSHVIFMEFTVSYWKSQLLSVSLQIDFGFTSVSS